MVVFRATTEFFIELRLVRFQICQLDEPEVWVRVNKLLPNFPRLIRTKWRANFVLTQ